MGGGDRDAAAGEVAGDEARRGALRRRRRARSPARRAATAAGGATSRRASAARRRCPAERTATGSPPSAREADRVERGRRPRPRCAPELRPEVEVLARRVSAGLQRVEMADIVHPAAPIFCSLAGVSATSPGRRLEQPAISRSRVDLPAPLRPGDAPAASPAATAANDDAREHLAPAAQPPRGRSRSGGRHVGDAAVCMERQGWLIVWHRLPIFTIRPANARRRLPGNAVILQRCARRRLLEIGEYRTWPRRSTASSPAAP